MKRFVILGLVITMLLGVVVYAKEAKVVALPEDNTTPIVYRHKEDDNKFRFRRPNEDKVIIVPPEANKNRKVVGGWVERVEIDENAPAIIWLAE